MTYVDGFVLAVPNARQEDYRRHAAAMAPMLREHGVLSLVECWGEDVPHGKRTDFYRATEATGDEVPVLSWIEWPDRATADAAWAAMMTEDHPDMADMPFDGARMFWGGFAPIVDLR